MELPSLDADGESVEQTVRGLIPWLPDPFKCPECGIFCKASVSYDHQLYDYVDSWICPNCEDAYRRMEPWD